MPRKRMIDPSIWDSKSFNALSSDRLRLGFICMFSNADDEGKGRASFLMSKLGMDEQELQNACSEYQSLNLCHFYFVQEGLDTILYYQLPKWYGYQTINRKGPSNIPNHPDFKKLTPVSFHTKYDTNNSLNALSRIAFSDSIHAPASLTVSSEPILLEGKGGEGKGTPPSLPFPSPFFPSLLLSSLFFPQEIL